MYFIVFPEYGFYDFVKEHDSYAGDKGNHFTDKIYGSS